MCCLLTAFGNNYELQLIFLQEITFSKYVQVRVVLHPAVSSLKSLFLVLVSKHCLFISFPQSPKPMNSEKKTNY